MVYLFGFVVVFGSIFAAEYLYNNPMRFVAIHDQIDLLSIEDTRDFKIFELEWQLSHPDILKDIFAAWQLNETLDGDMTPIFVENMITKNVINDMKLVPNIQLFEPHIRQGVSKIVRQYDWM